MHLFHVYVLGGIMSLKKKCCGDDPFIDREVGSSGTKKKKKLKTLERKVGLSPRDIV